MSKKRQSDIARLLEIAGEKKGLLVLSGALSVLSTVLFFVPYAAVYFIVAELLQNAVSGTASGALIGSWAIWALLGIVGALVLLYASTMASHVSAFNILYSLRMRLAQHLARLPLGYHTRQSTGKIKKTLEMSVEKIEGFIAHQLPDLAGAIAFPLMMLVAMFILDWRLALAAAVPIVGAFLMQALVFYGGVGQEAVKKHMTSLEEMNASGVEYVRGMPAVKVFGLTVHTFQQFRNSIFGYRDWVVKYTRFCKHPYMIFMLILSSSLTFILPVGVFALSGNPANQAFALTLLLFLVLAPGLSSPVLKLMYLGGSMRIISEGVKRVDELFAEQPTAEPAAPRQPQGCTVEFDDVSFSYDSEEAATRTEALTGVSFAAREGEMTALVGPSGSGKSTIASLIPRFWDVTSGRILVGGVDVRDIGTERLMDMVSFVFQDVHLFFDTIEENIRMGKSDATPAQVVAAARAACCHEFIKKLPEGYQTRIGEGGTYLSGGEAQRVAIARAILKNAPILVLDEATAYADPENEVNIQKGLGALISGKTLIVIAHRLSSIREANQIIVVNRGQVEERGTHAQLVEANGLYRRMWNAHIDAGAWELGADETEEEVQPA